MPDQQPSAEHTKSPQTAFSVRAGGSPAYVVAQVQALFRGIDTAVVAHLVAATPTLFVLWPSVPGAGFALWFAGVVAVQGARFALRHVGRERVTDTSALMWLAALRGGALLAGLSWAVLPIWLYPMDTQYQLLQATVLAAVSGAAVVGLAVDRVSLLMFVVPVLGALMGRSFLEGGDVLVTIGVMSIVYCGYLAVAGVRSERTFREQHSVVEQAAQQSELLRDTRRRAALASWTVDLITGHTEWEPELYRIFARDPRLGPPPDLAAYVTELAHPDDAAALFALAEKTLSQPGTTHSADHRVPMPDGSVRWVNLEGVARPSRTGQGLRLSGTVQDITARKTAELALVERERQLREAQQLARLGSFDWNLLTGQLQWSDEHFRLWGLEPASCAPDYATFVRGIHPQDVGRVERVLKQSMRDSSHYDCEHRVVWPDGTERHIRGLGEPVFDKAGRAVRMLGTVQDVTESRQAVEELMIARNAAEAANRAKSEFLSHMSHELRTPMNAILGFSQLMQSDERTPPESRATAQEILRAGWHMVQLVDDVLDFARLESGQISMSLGAVDVASVAEECAGLVRPLAEQHRVTVVCGDMAGAVVHADRTRFKQSLINLLSNAIKYNRPGGRVEVEALRADATRVRVRVADTGYGLPAHRFHELWEPFNRLDAARGRVQGTGIGLTITRRFVEMMGGTIGVESKVGEGSRFWIDLPAGS